MSNLARKKNNNSLLQQIQRNNNKYYCMSNLAGRKKNKFEIPLQS